MGIASMYFQWQSRYSKATAEMWNEGCIFLCSFFILSDQVQALDVSDWSSYIMIIYEWIKQKPSKGFWTWIDWAFALLVCPGHWIVPQSMIQSFNASCTQKIIWMPTYTHCVTSFSVCFIQCSCHMSVFYISYEAVVHTKHGIEKVQ